MNPRIKRWHEMVKCRNTRGIRYRIYMNLTSFEKKFSDKSMLAVLEKIWCVSSVLPWAIRVEDEPWLVPGFPVPVARIDGHLGNGSQ
jgi:hypothetical protein